MEADAKMLEGRISEWRAYMGRHPRVEADGLEELEGRLRAEAVGLRDSGLDGGEAFLVALRRVGSVDAATREFGRAHAGRLWEQPEAGDGGGDADTGSFLGRALAALVPGGKDARTEAIMVLALAVAAALLVKAPGLFGVEIGGDDAGFLP